MSSMHLGTAKIEIDFLVPTVVVVLEMGGGGGGGGTGLKVSKI